MVDREDEEEVEYYFEHNPHRPKGVRQYKKPIGPDPFVKTPNQYPAPIGPAPFPKPKAKTQYKKPIGPQEPRAQRAARLGKRVFEGSKRAFLDTSAGLQNVASHLPRSQFEDVYPQNGTENFGFNFGDFGGQRDYDWGFNLPITGAKKRREDSDKTVIVIQGNKVRRIKKKKPPERRGRNLPDFGFKFKGF